VVMEAYFVAELSILDRRLRRGGHHGHGEIWISAIPWDDLRRLA